MECGNCRQDLFGNIQHTFQPYYDTPQPYYDKPHYDTIVINTAMSCDVERKAVYQVDYFAIMSMIILLYVYSK